MKNVLELIKERRIFFDGGMGTCLQAEGLMPGEKPENWCLTKPEVIEKIHRDYFEAGANIVTTNTFGVNRDKFSDYEEIIEAAIAIAKKATDGKEDRFVAFDMGPTGRLLKPLGDMDFEYCVELFAANIRCAAKYSPDLIIIETMNDALETKAAVLAAKENCNLPVFVTNAYDATGKLMTGANPKAMIAMLEGLGVDAVGINCSQGPNTMAGITYEFGRYSSLPVIVNPNAGLPKIRDGKTVYDLTPSDFAECMKEIVRAGATVVGGCCGTTPEYIKETVKALRGMEYHLPTKKEFCLVSSYTHAVEIGKEPVLIGERINPTGKKKLKEALQNSDMDYVLAEGIRQADKGVHILDVNVGVPGIDEASVMEKVVTSLQAVTDKPLQIDTSDYEAMERAMRIYAGKPMVNSVSGKKESMDKVLPLVKKYGGVLIALTLDESGIPDTAKGRYDIAMRIIEEAAKYGIDKKDVVVDPLALTVSSDAMGALVTLEAIELLTSEGIHTSLGVSNISFGLPARDLVNSAFFTRSLGAGLKCAIMNPFSESMMNSYYSHRVLNALDKSCEDYIAYADGKESKAAATAGDTDLKTAIVKGLKDAAASACTRALETQSPMDVINAVIIPALNEIGSDFEAGKAYLPQLLMSADAASVAFDIVKTKISKKDSVSEKPIIIATVKGDIHDIGKNIVKVVLESYGFEVLDLGKDVAPQTVCEAVTSTGAVLVGLSALMTTTVPAMEETIALIKETHPNVKVMVGGAVLTEEYASVIGAHYYAADAMDAAKIVREFFGN